MHTHAYFRKSDCLSLDMKWIALLANGANGAKEAIETASMPTIRVINEASHGLLSQLCRICPFRLCRQLDHGFDVRTRRLGLLQKSSTFFEKSVKAAMRTRTRSLVRRDAT